MNILFINSTVVCGDTYQKSCQTNWSFLKYVFSKFCPKNCWGNKKILVSTSHFRYFVHVVLNSKSLQLRSLVQFLFKKKIFGSIHIFYSLKSKTNFQEVSEKKIWPKTNEQYLNSRELAFNTYGRRRRSNWKAENVPYELWMKITAFSLANLQPYTVTYFRESHSENEYVCSFR